MCRQPVQPYLHHAHVFLARVRDRVCIAAICYALPISCRYSQFIDAVRYRIVLCVIGRQIRPGILPGRALRPVQRYRRAYRCPRRGIRALVKLYAHAGMCRQPVQPYLLHAHVLHKRVRDRPLIFRCTR